MQTSDNATFTHKDKNDVTSHTTSELQIHPQLKHNHHNSKVNATKVNAAVLTIFNWVPKTVCFSQECRRHHQ